MAAQNARVSVSALAGTFLVSAAVLLAEIALIRVFSFLLAYHYVFMLVGLALLGLGVGAAAVYWLGWTARPPAQTTDLALLAVGASATVAVAVVLAGPIAESGAPLLYLAVAGLPFLPAGAALALVFARHSEQSGRLYLADLAGAAAGVLLAIGGLSLVGAPGALLLAGVLFALAGLAFACNGPRAAWQSALLAVLLATALFGQQMTAGATGLSPAAVGPGKTLSVALESERLQATVEWSRWNAFARTDVVSYGVAPDEKLVFIDGGAGSLMHRFDGDLDMVADLREEVGYYPFAVRKPGETLVIGPGGGLDVLLALLGEADNVTAVEVNPGTVEAMQRFADFNGALYDHPRVKVFVDEGRSFLRRSAASYDTIYLSLVMAQAAERPGLALAENYIYTVEAMQDYLAHLSADGLLAIKLHDSVDLGRAFATAIAALEREGKSPEQAARQTVIYYDPRHSSQHGEQDVAYPVLMVFASPLSPAEGRRIEGELAERGMQALLVPHVLVTEPFTGLALGESSLSGFVSRWHANVSPTYDDRPFFFEVRRGLPPQLTLMMVLLLLLGAGGWPALAGAPPLSGRKPRGFALYFACLGVGFTLVQVASIQRMGLFLGHPSIAVASSLAVLLLAMGAGGLLAQRIPVQYLPRATAVASAVAAAFVLVWAQVAPSVLDAQLAQVLPVRLLVAGLLLAPLGVALGVPFPAALRLAGHTCSAGAVPAFWAVNGFASIVGSVLGMTVALLAGFTAALSLGAVAYFAAAATARVVASIPAPDLASETLAASPANEAKMQPQPGLVRAMPEPPGDH